MTEEAQSHQSTMSIRPTGHALSLLFLISHLLCIAFGLLAPDQMRMVEVWAPLLPGFEWLTVSGFLFGLVGAYLSGWYLAVVFVPLYRFFAQRP